VTPSAAAGEIRTVPVGAAKTSADAEHKTRTAKQHAKTAVVEGRLDMGSPWGDDAEFNQCCEKAEIRSDLAMSNFKPG
jgi:hypothetical protein